MRDRKIRAPQQVASASNPSTAHEGGEGDTRSGVEETGEGGGTHGQPGGRSFHRHLTVESVFNIGEHLIDAASSHAIKAGDISL